MDMDGKKTKDCEVIYMNWIINEGKLTGYEGELPSHLVIPDGVKEIGVRAFSRAFTLESVVIADSVLSIDSLAFEECVHLSSIVLPANGLRLYATAFEKCISLIKLDIPEGTEVIGQFNFYAHFHPEDPVEVPDFVSSIERHGFTGGGTRDDKRWYLAFNVLRPFYQCDSIRFYDHVAWNIDLYDSFWQCNKLVLCSHETKEIKRTLWINGHDAKRWGRWGVHKYLTEFASMTDGVLILRNYDTFLPTLAQAKDKSLAMMYRLSYPEDLSDKDRDIFVEYLKKNRKRTMCFIIDNRDPVLLETADSIGLITKRNIDSLIQYAGDKNDMAVLLKERKGKSENRGLHEMKPEVRMN